MNENCDRLDWNPLVTAPLNSQLAGVLAGLVFAGIILLLSTKAEHRGSACGRAGQPTEALTLFIGAFLALLMASFLFGVASGDTVCARGWTIIMFTAGLMGLGVLGVFGGMCWLVDHYDHGSRRGTRLTLLATHVVAFVIAFDLWATAGRYLHDVGELSHTPRWLSITVSVYSWVFLFTVAVLFARTVYRRHRRTLLVRVPEAFVVATAHVYVLCVAVASVMAGQTIVLTPDRPISNEFFIAATLVALGVPGFAVCLQLLALPNGRADE